MNVLLDVPYFSQLDPQDGPRGWRQCQTSSIAMCLAYLKVPGIRDDTDYLRVVNTCGDTTSQATHRQALAKIKAPGKFSQTLGVDDLKASLLRGFPAAIGILHHGPIGAVGGGGHYIVVRGFDDRGWLVHDPYGELDLVNGRWVRVGSGSGRSLKYSFGNTNPRWLPEGPTARTGWGWIFG
jgi:hypothetical protein